ncbi:MAG: alpha/beta hydrolase, partial [Maribacter sp.]|nr:alpha/beta hydrolase [Maribacter sp.]
MKNTITLSILFLAIISASAQDITGQWHGVLKEIQLRLVLNISKTDTGYSSTMDSPDQGTKGIPVTTTSFEDSTLQIAV